MYKEGLGVSRNIPEAKRFLRRAVEHGNPLAAELLNTF
jgi:TPR repeat protein